jgi:hypothetical protein
MGRADTPEDQRQDFSLYVDEFQNFATESFESILSEARKYRLNLILGNQFMTQLTDKIREAIIGNVGTVISGRIGITDAEMLVKKFAPTFDAEDLTKMPNYQSVTSVMVNNVPSAPFSMSFVPPMGQSNPELSSALKRLSAAKYGKPRSVVEKDIFDRLGAADAEKRAKLEALKKAQQQRLSGAPAPAAGAASKTGSSFLDEWLAKRQQMGGGAKPPAMGASASPRPLAPPQSLTPPSSSPSQSINPFLNPPAPTALPPAEGRQPTTPSQPPATPEKLSLRGDDANHDDTVSIKIR